MTGTFAPSPRTRPTRNAQRVSHDRAAVHAVLDGAFLCHVGFVVDGRPVVLPHLYARVDDVLYLHGSTGARALRGTAGLEVCVTVTLVDALVLARSAFQHSANSRCVVVHGRSVPVRHEQDKRAALDALVESVARGRSQECRPPSAKELAATAVLALPLQEVSLKARTGPPVDDDADLGLGHWAGVLPLQTVAGSPEPADGVTAPVPPSVTRWGPP